MSDVKKKDDELGALWIKQSARGEYMTGTIGDQKVVVFRNDKKTNEKQPDWRILKSKPREDRPQGQDIGGGFTQVSSDDIGF